MIRVQSFAWAQARDRRVFERPYGANLWDGSCWKKIEELGLDTDAAESFGLRVPVGGNRCAGDLTPTSTVVGVRFAEEMGSLVATRNNSYRWTCFSSARR